MPAGQLCFAGCHQPTLPALPLARCPPSLAQTHCFTTPEGASAVDWLGRQENFDEDFAALIDVLNARPGVPQLPRPEGGVERVNYNASPCEGATGAAAGDAGNSTAVAAAEGQPALAARRALRSAWAVREGILNPCDKMDFFRWAATAGGRVAVGGMAFPQHGSPSTGHRLPARRTPLVPHMGQLPHPC